LSIFHTNVGNFSQPCKLKRTTQLIVFPIINFSTYKHSLLLNRKLSINEEIWRNGNVIFINIKTLNNRKRISKN